MVKVQLSLMISLASVVFASSTCVKVMFAGSIRAGTIAVPVPAMRLPPSIPVYDIVSAVAASGADSSVADTISFEIVFMSGRASPWLIVM